MEKDDGENISSGFELEHFGWLHGTCCYHSTPSFQKDT